MPVRNLIRLVPAALVASVLACGADGLDQESIGRTKAALSGNASFVAGSTSLNSADSFVRNHLSTKGLTVTVKAASSVTSADANGKALVVVSSTVSPTAVSTKFRNVGQRLPLVLL
jgi:hypothetical protein